MSHIFISYSHKDTDYAQKLQNALIQEGFEVWIDDRIEYGDEWPMVIQERLDACDVFILLATENSYRSEWVRKEVTRAQRLQKRFFPLLLDGQPWLTIESTQYVDVRDRSLPTEKFYKKLALYTARNKTTPSSPPTVEEQLSALKEQATRHESIGDFWNALNAWYEIKRLDPHFPHVDQKIDELEKEWFRIRQKSKMDAESTPAPKRTLHPLSTPISTHSKGFLTTLRDTFYRSGKLSFSSIAGLIILLLVFLGAGAWLVSVLNPSPPQSNDHFPFVFSVETEDEVNVYSYDMYSNRLSLINLGPGKNWDPTYSALGNIYFTSDRDGKAEIYRFVDGIPERVTFTADPYQSWDPALSPNGTLYFTSNQFGGKAEICRLVNEQLVRVTDTPGQFESWGPVVSVNGTLYYTTNREHKREVYKLVNGQPQYVTVTPENYESWGPAISPLTGAVYFTSNRGDGKAEIYRLVDDAQADPVTNRAEGYESWGPIITADGTIFYTSTKENGERKVFMLANGISESLPDIPGQAMGFTDFLTGILPPY